MWVYRHYRGSLYQTGFYGPDGVWHKEHEGSPGYCARRVVWLNGGGGEEPKDEVMEAFFDRWLNGPLIRDCPPVSKRDIEIAQRRRATERALDCQPCHADG